VNAANVWKSLQQDAEVYGEFLHIEGNDVRKREGKHQGHDKAEKFVLEIDT